VELVIYFHLPPPSAQRRQIARADIDRRLDKLEQLQSSPSKRLTEIYQDIWNMALGDDDEHSTRAALIMAMKWVLCTFRPLKMVELLDALASDSCELFDEAILLERCSNLIVKDSSGYLRLAHLSVKHFFEDHLTADFAPRLQHSQAALCSLLVVAKFRQGSESFATLLSTSEDNEYDREVGRKSFALYCRLHWAQHYSLSDRNPSLRVLLDAHRDVLNRPFDNLICWVTKRTTSKPDLPSLEIVDLNEHAEPRQLRQHLLTKMKHTLAMTDPAATSTIDPSHASLQWISAVADQGHGRTQEGSNALLYASGVVDKSNTLHMDNRDELHVRDSDADGNTVLHYAAFFDASLVLHDFVQRSSYVEAVNLSGETPLQVAVAENSVDSLLGLIQCGASCSALDSDQLPRNSLEQFMDDDAASKDLTRPLYSTHSRLHVDQSGRSCRTCDLPAWLEASRQGDAPYLQPKDYRPQSDGTTPDCTLCKEMHDLRDRTRYQYSNERLSTNIRIMLDVESHSTMGRDILRFQTPGAAALDYELYITSSGTSEPMICTSRPKGMDDCSRVPPYTEKN
jgi:hypothetical protein